MAWSAGLLPRRRLRPSATGRGTERVAVVGQALRSNLALLIREQGMPLLLEYERLNCQIKAVALPQSDVPIGDNGRAKQNASGLESAMVVKHLKEPGRVVAAFAQGTPIHGHHGGIKPPFEVGQGRAHVFLTSG